MKIRTKLFGGFFIVVAIGVLLGVSGLKTSTDMTNWVNDLHGLSQTSSNISSILNSHYTWRHGLSEAVYAGSDFTGSLNSATCSLGQWLNSDEVKSMTDEEGKRLLNLIVEPHNFIHAKAGEIINHLNNDGTNEAATIFREAVLPSTQEVISGLQNLEKHYSGLLENNTDDIYHNGVKFERFIIVLIIVSLVISIILSLLITLNIVRPLGKVTVSMKDIAHGDFTKRVNIRSKDEIGFLAEEFNETVGHVSTLISKIKYKIDALTNTGHELNINMAKTSEVVGELSVNFDEMKTVKTRQEKSAVEAESAVKEIQTSINNLNKMVEEQSESVNTSSSAIEEMTANIRSVTKTLIENTKNVNELSESSEHGKAGVQMVAEKIQDIARDSAGLLEINSVMENIASQTNLLSMNAAIEAAHAGEAGKGFAVVASEIRKLAESSASQSKTTAEMLKKIKTSIDSITLSSNEVISRFNIIDSGVKTVSHHEQNIRSAMEEQEIGGQQILNSMGRLKELSVSVEKGSEEMRTTGNHLISQTNDLIKSSTEAINGMSDIVSGAMKQIQTAVKQVDEMGTENTRNFNELKSEAGKFKISSGNEKKKIIVVDDDEIHLEMTNEVLKNDYEVFTVSSGEKALEKFFQGLVPNLVLLDLIMPEMDGWNTYDRIKRISELHQVPIAFFTVSDDPKDINRAREIGAVDYIKKPCDDLLVRIKKLI
ncbi:MAG: methyl-accepting chemotaxis protein [Treponema sp.]|nr:methyl-accepting chemotaxis protein [Treponema sp.]